MAVLQLLTAWCCMVWVAQEVVKELLTYLVTAEYAIKVGDGLSESGGWVVALKWCRGGYSLSLHRIVVIVVE